MRISKAFEALSDQYQAIIEIVCGENILNTYAETKTLNPVAMHAMRDQYEVNIVRLTDDRVAAFEKAWNWVPRA
jgi:TRAP-type mannitol/chloroaromatic compound transport system substrate-binding protein